ncbi:MAG: hypothetical protein ACLFVT_04315 [Syntrophobacteria bacterium]
MYVGEFLCSALKRSLASLLPWDIPWYDPSHTIFFVCVYGALGVIGLGLLVALARTLQGLVKKESHH